MSDERRQLLVSYEQVQFMLGGVSRTIVKQLRREGKIRAAKLGGRTLFHTDSVESFVQTLKSEKFVDARSTPQTPIK